ncbi:MULTISPECIES: hypothetical protein [unclassified Solwaraspora]|uniref:hypothetical protein n=1 Tax=unclassified Solwaraspora TaxID=2627926 RepID=UPI00259B27F6|nr:hypothetical protein [Solwaraspora sp. WMMA2056]WJK41629.1 hypothetical protein O7608_04155 [Solwaraspora sp. WMMA2056]
MGLVDGVGAGVGPGVGTTGAGDVGATGGGDTGPTSTPPDPSPRDGGTVRVPVGGRPA